jgi:hypothetical protein
VPNQTEEQNNLCLLQSKSKKSPNTPINFHSMHTFSLYDYTKKPSEYAFRRPRKGCHPLSPKSPLSKTTDWAWM